MRVAGLFIFLCAFVASAQITFPGQSPYPGGGPYPNGGPNPNGQPGGNRRNRQQQPDDKGRRSDSKSTVTSSADGIMRRASSSQLVIETGDHRIVWFRINGKTTTTKDGRDADAKDFEVGDHVSVDYTEDDDGIYFASNIAWNSAGTSAEKAESARTWDLPRSDVSTAEQSRKTNPSSSSRGDDDRPILRRGNKPGDTASTQSNPAPKASPPRTAPPPPETAQTEPEDTRPATQIKPPDPPSDADDPGRPKLRRGEPIVVNPPKPPAPPVEAANRPAPKAQPQQAPAPAVIPIQEDPAIAKAREVAFEFSDKLPNFFCQQITTRYRTENAKRGWDPIDIVTADVTSEDGSETYKNIKVGNKPVNKSMEDIGGTTSTGEFSSELLALLQPGSGATFKRNGSDTIAGRNALVYKFEVPREQSTWRVEGPSQLYYPAYRGTIWIDKESSRVLRVEQEGRNMPLQFVFDTVETSVDYDYVRLGTPTQYLLPVAAEALSCQRGTSFCSRNRIEFRNYRKFEAESSIKFGTTEDK